MTLEHNDTKTAMVVMEAGARWPSYSSELAGRASSAVVESQPASESSEEFATRVVGRLARLAERQVTLPVAILATSQRIDSEARDARYQIARSILNQMTAQGLGELVIMGDEHFGDDVRHELMAFVGALCDGLAGSPVTVRVRFGAGRSGTRAIGLPGHLSRASGSS
ncbi:MAG: hypothetical protein IPI67_29045 [Myxococcales bacterium]|nr:hypothetical protein [Myxococcales bacterium]